MTVLHMSGAYELQDFYPHTACIDCRDLSGTNGYCDDAAKTELRRRLSASDLYDLHFLDSGNYHYLSLFFLERIKEPFDLVLFDHHPDMQRPAFDGMLSCGSWVREAMDGLPYFNDVYLIGVNYDLLREAIDAGVDGSRLHYVHSEEMEAVSMDALTLSQGSRPVYVSLDKDVLCRRDAVCDWEQGEMELCDVLQLLDRISSERELLGMDVCGEDRLSTQATDRKEIVEINNATNRVLRDWWLSKEMSKPYECKRRCGNIVF